MIILINSNDKFSRNWVDKHRSEIKGAKIIDWYKNPEAAQYYLRNGYPSPSSFPTVVDTENKFSVRRPTDFESAKEALRLKREPDEKQEARLHLSQGFPAPGLDFKMSMSETSRKNFSDLAVLIVLGLQTGSLKANSKLSILDMEGNRRNLTVSQLSTLLVEYGLAYKGLLEILSKK